ncbi:MAG: alpha/beta hydrolase [Deltaproteobacteria bacterium]|nr:alpha/beta hydrolase [Deltaproteobacteria bacterium]MBI3293886.1 alpha/beta hydrolase [Deltaproteobacteria bacterium]
MREKIANTGLKAVLNTFFRPPFTAQKMRRHFDLLAGKSAEGVTARYPDVRITRADVGRIPVESTTVNGSQRTILYLHGGGYFMGSILAYRLNAAKIARRCRATVVLPEYRLAPENRFPAALEDAVEVYRALLEKTSTPPIIGGDSAGGGLALATMLKLLQLGLPRPTALFCFSPWTDLTQSNPSWAEKREEIWLRVEHNEIWAREYGGDHDLRDPLISPLFGDLHDFPRTLVFVGELEALHDDGAKIVERINAAGGSAELFIGKKMQHVWPLFLPFLPESRRAMDKLAEFVV